MRVLRASLLVLCSLQMHAQVSAPAAASTTISFERAITLAQANEPLFVTAAAERKALALERTNAKTALLPSVTYHNMAIYTKPNGVAASRIGQTAGADAPAFIANNAIREYASQGVVDEKVGLRQLATVRVANAAALRAEAEAEIARRGLVATVSGFFYGAQASADKVAIATEALAEANRFVDITQKRESAREAARADVLKAQLQQQQRERDLADAKLAATKARLELGVLLFADPGTTYTLDVPALPPGLPDRAEVETLARANNAEVRSAAAGVQSATANSFASRAALTPDLALNYTYGIDATNFGVNGPDGIRNLGYSLSATLDIPVWDWLATERTIKASRLREDAAKVTLTAAQRRSLANVQEFYNEAETASQQLISLDKSVLTARESLRLVNLRYVDGESTVLEVVDAQSTLLAAETAEVDGQVRYQVARAQLQTLTGRLP